MLRWATRGDARSEGRQKERVIRGFTREVDTKGGEKSTRGSVALSPGYNNSRRKRVRRKIKAAGGGVRWEVRMTKWQ